MEINGIVMIIKLLASLKFSMHQHTFKLIFFPNSRQVILKPFESLK